MFGLSDAQLNLIRAVFRRYPSIEEVRIFGSRALGTSKPSSDIDLALLGDIGQKTCGSIALDLDELPLPYVFDVQSYADVDHAPLKEHIDRHGKRLYLAE